MADDDEYFRLALRMVLTSKLGFTDVLEAPSLDDAVEQLSSGSNVDLALFDLSMPGMESAASLRAIRECYEDLPIAVISGSSRRRDILLALASGVHGYIPKSVGAMEIARALDLVLDGVIYVPPSLAELDDGDEKGGERSPATSGTSSAGSSLTPRQLDVLELLVRGKSNKEIARALNLGEGTVKVHVSALLRTLGVTTRSAAAVSGAKLLEATR